MKINNLTEAMFAQAVSLAQNGKMKSTIHCGGNVILVQNMDSTILLGFETDQMFDEEFSFFANDYESKNIEIENGKVVFTTYSEGLKRTKVCASPRTTFMDVRASWKHHKPDKSQKVMIPKAVISLLEDGLSHVELGADKDSIFKLIQRDIYSGSRVEVHHEIKDSDFDLDDGLCFGPVGVRTVDFMSLFTFLDTITFYPQKDEDWLYFESVDSSMNGILATCIYDELGVVGKEG